VTVSLEARDPQQEMFGFESLKEAVQQAAEGTPEEIITNPADDYVADFVQGISRLKLIYARTIMRPVDEHKADGSALIESPPWTEGETASIEISFQSPILPGLADQSDPLIKTFTYTIPEPE